MHPVAVIDNVNVKHRNGTGVNLYSSTSIVRTVGANRLGSRVQYLNIVVVLCKTGAPVTPKLGYACDLHTDSLQSLNIDDLQPQPGSRFELLHPVVGQGCARALNALGQK